MTLSRLQIAGLAAVAAAAIAFIGAVYVTGGGYGNRLASGSPAPAPVAGAPAVPSGTGAKVAAFVLHAEAKPVPQTAFLTGEGTPVSLSDWNGRAILVNLWATWCAPCRHEMPSLDRLQAKLGGPDFEVVAISLDRGGPAKAQAFYDEIGVKTLKLYSDTTMKVGTALAAVGMPTTILIDAEGREVGRLAGPAEWDSPEALALLARAVGLGS